MTESTYHHVGVLVPDMDKAIAWFVEVEGISFHPPRRMTTAGRIDPNEFGDDEPHQGTSYLAWSKQGPPYYELVQAKGNGLHSIERHGAGLHHVGQFVPDVDAMMARLAAQGVGVEGRVLGPGGTTMVCWASPTPATGLIVEYMDERMRAGIQGWIDTGIPPAVPGAIAAQ